MPDVKPSKHEKDKHEVAETPKSPTCGLIMPISALDGCTADHWAEVKSIVIEAVESVADPTFSVRLVSDSDAVGIIQKRIVQNVYSSEIVLCDVSGKNPNVMFELGMRLAFDKPTVIIKDDKTEYAFDTGIIEHIPYPRDLRFAKIVEFKKAVADKVLNTYKVARANPEHSTFLRSFGKFQVASLAETEVSPDKLVIGMLEDLQSDMQRMRRRMEGPDPEIRRRVSADDRTIAGLVGLTQCIQKYRESAGVDDPSALLGDEKFYTLMEEDSDAPKFFEGPDVFRRTLESILRGMASAKK